MAAIAARNLKLFIDGHEVRLVKGLSIVADVGSVVMFTIEMYGKPTWDADGNIYIDTTSAQHGLVAAPGLPTGLRIRGMQLEGDIPVG